MPSYRVSESSVIAAPPERVYAVLADYRQGHPDILPRPPFESLEVEEGGIGAGTVIRVRIRVLGRARTFRATVTEPDPGRVLVETDVTTGTATSFTVDPLDDGRQARVTIATDMRTRGGPLGVVQRILLPRLLRPIYVRELARLAASVAGKTTRP